MLFCYKLFSLWPHCLCYIDIQNLVAVTPVNHSLSSSQLSLEFHPAQTWIGLVVFRGPQ